MPRSVRSIPFVLLLLLLLLGPAYGQEARIAWSKSLKTALATAKDSRQVVMVCVNAKHVQGREEEEPGAKGLREVVYKDPRVVKKSREFICVLLTPDSSSTDYGELRTLGIGGQIVSPQHIFVSPDGDRILVRREYWRHGKGEKAVLELLALMEKAEQRAKEPADPPEAAPGGEGKVEGPPAEDGERATWIAGLLKQVEGKGSERGNALRALVNQDKDGDCTGPLIALLPENKKNIELLRALIRALGRDGLEAAALPIAGFLGHRDHSIRSEAAVSLEYIGSREKKVVSALMKAAGRQKDEAVANHMYRALGRCGVKDGRAISLLLKAAASGKSEFGTYGASIGLAYFEHDKKAMRGVEKIVKVIGVPGGRRGGGQNTVKRGLLSWTLASIGDEKSADFVRKELIAKLENMKAFWVNPLKNFYGAVAGACDGEESALAEVEGGVRRIVQFARGGNMERYGAETRSLMDDSRKGRDNSTFTPKGDNLLDSGDGGD